MLFPYGSNLSFLTSLFEDFFSAQFICLCTLLSEFLLPSTNVISTSVSLQTAALRETWTWRSWSASPSLPPSPLSQVSRVTPPTASARTPTWAASQSLSSPTRSTTTSPSRSRLNLQRGRAACCSPSQTLTKRWSTYISSNCSASWK